MCKMCVQNIQTACDFLSVHLFCPDSSNRICATDVFECVAKMLKCCISRFLARFQLPFVHAYSLDLSTATRRRNWVSGSVLGSLLRDWLDAHQVTHFGGSHVP